MTIKEVDLNKIYYFKYSNRKIPAMLIPIDVEDSSLGSRGHFWTKGYLYDTAVKKWYYKNADWILGSPQYTEASEFSKETIRESINALFESGIEK